MMEALCFLVARGLDPQTMAETPSIDRPLATVRLGDEVAIRCEYVERFGCAVPTPRAIEALRALAPIVEVGAGAGYWTYELRRAGIEAVATDPGSSRGYRRRRIWTSVEPLTGPQAVLRYPRHTLLLVWPEGDATWPVETLRAYDGERVVYVGEAPGGATGDDAFHDYLERVFDLETEIALPQFLGVHDALTIWRRQPAMAQTASAPVAPERFSNLEGSR